MCVLRSRPTLLERTLSFFSSIHRLLLLSLDNSSSFRLSSGPLAAILTVRTLLCRSALKKKMEAKYVSWRNSYLRSSPSGLYCYYNGKGDNGNAITCSEAHGYAMLISVLHRNRVDFDGLLTFFLNFRNEKGLMCWQVRSLHQPSSSSHEGGGPVQPFVEEDGKTSATDGDVDIASSLYIAIKTFGDDGRYRHIADSLTSAILRYTIHPELGTPLLGDWANKDSPEGVRLYNATRTSDFILSAFALFNRYHSNAEERHRWGWVLESTKRAAMSCGGTTGFLPDFLEFNASKGRWQGAKGKLLESEHDGALNWNACRTPWRLAHYLAVTGDTSILPLLQHAHRSARNDPAFNFPNIPAGVQLTTPHHSGGTRGAKALVDYTDKAFIAPVGYLCFVLGDAQGQQECVRALRSKGRRWGILAIRSMFLLLSRRGMRMTGFEAAREKERTRKEGTEGSERRIIDHQLGINSRRYTLPSHSRRVRARS